MAAVALYIALADGRFARIWDKIVSTLMFEVTLISIEHTVAWVK